MGMERTQLIELRNHLRLTWRSMVSAFYLMDDILGPKQQYLLKIDPIFHSVSAAAYTYLLSSRGFIRTADKAADVMGIPTLQEFNKNILKEFPEHKNARDIIEHYDEYAIGEGSLQKKGQHNFEGAPIAVKRNEHGELIITVFNLDPIPLSKFSWWTDALNFYTESNLHETIDPDTEWKGLWPQYNYEAPPDWKTR